jgi:hypothetical protein
MKKALVFILILSVCSALWAQQKFALVIGNANYTGIPSLRNPVNDANDMEAALQALGFTVDKVLNGNLDDMEAAIIRLKTQLSRSTNTYGFFFYAGHGVQSGEDNFLIPVDANTIRGESHLGQRAVSLQFVLDSMTKAENELNMIVLDACRNNPFDWARNNRSASNSRGLYRVSHAPGSIVMYAAAAGQEASDGTGQNGLFTGYLLNNLRTPNLSVYEVFDRTMGSVIQATGGAQHPEISIRYPGANLAYLGTRPPNPNPNPTPNPAVSLYDQLVNATGTVTITVTQVAELPLETVISRASFITLRGDTANRTVLGSGSNHLIKIERGVTLTLENITLRGVGIDVNAGGTLVMNNAATITGCTNVNGGGGVYVRGGTFTMSGGTISGNTGNTGTNNGGYGGGVCVEDGTFTMSGGTISGNTTRFRGGGVYVSGTFTMRGGTISGNRASGYGGGVFVYYFYSGTFRMTGGTIYGSNGGSNANRAGGTGKGHAVYDGTRTFKAQDSTVSRYN